MLQRCAQPPRPIPFSRSVCSGAGPASSKLYILPCPTSVAVPDCRGEQLGGLQQWGCGFSRGQPWNWLAGRGLQTLWPDRRLLRQPGRPCPEGSAAWPPGTQALPPSLGINRRQPELAQGPASGREAAAEIGDRALKARAQGNGRLPAQLLLARVDHRLALESVVLGQGQQVCEGPADGSIRSRPVSASWRSWNSPGLPMLIGPECFPRSSSGNQPFDESCDEAEAAGLAAFARRG